MSSAHGHLQHNLKSKNLFKATKLASHKSEGIDLLCPFFVLSLETIVPFCSSERSAGSTETSAFVLMVTVASSATSTVFVSLRIGI